MVASKTESTPPWRACAGKAVPVDVVLSPVDVLHAAVAGLQLVFSWPNILYPIIGTLVAMCVAVLPGVSGATLLALAIPLTFSWEPLPIMLLFGALVGGATFMGSVSAILLNIPGTAPNAATLLDGHPMALRGQARTALACSATASALGSTLGVVALVASVPLVSRALPLVGPPEMLVLSTWGLLSVAVVIRGSMLKGLTMVCLGLMVSFVGLDTTTAVVRFTFGSLLLEEGLSLVPVFVGLFAIAEIIDLVASGRETVAGDAGQTEMGGSVRQGISAVLRNPKLLLRSSLIGTVVGLVPGLGGTVAGFVAYGDAARTVDDDSEFGSGDIRGVLAPEAANDAKDGGSLLPALAFGIPASTGTALLLAALQVHGIRPGSELLTTQLELAFVLIWSLFLSNWLTSLVGLSAVRPLARLTLVPTARLAPAVLLLATLGALSFRGRMSDVFIAFAFGAIGFGMKRFEWPRIAFVIAFILGPLFELNLKLSLNLHALGRLNLWTHPSVVIGTLALGVVLLLSRRKSCPARPS